MTKVIFLDFDGVIVESADIKTAAFRQLYDSFGNAVVDQVVAHHQANGGISRRKKIRYCHKEILGISLNESDLNSLCQRFSELVEDAVVAAPSVRGVVEFLEVNVGKKYIYVVSGTPEAELLRIVGRRALNKYFSGVFGSPREKPDIINSVLNKLGIPPVKALFIGDALTDYNAARVCAVPFIGRVAHNDENPFPVQSRVIKDFYQFRLEF